MVGKYKNLPPLKPTRFQKNMIFIFIILLFLVYLVDIILLLTFNVQSRIVLHSPVSLNHYPPVFRAMGYAWDHDSLVKGEDIYITVHLKQVQGGQELTFPASCSAVKSKGQVLFQLAAYSAPIKLPYTDPPTTWTIFARMTTPAGLVWETTPREITIHPQARSHDFQFFSIEHTLSLLVLLIFCVIIVLMFMKNRNKQLIPATSIILVIILWGNEFIYRGYWVWLGAWMPSIALMAQMCGIAILMVPFALFTWQEKIRQYLIEIIFFWGLGGSIQALLTPDIGPHGFPEFKFFAFFISHGFIVIISLFLISAHNIRITLASYLRAVIITNIGVIISFIINHLLTYVAPFEPGNYFAVGYPPPDGSIIDLFVEIFGPSPWYIIGLEIMGLVVFALLCVPFIFMKKKNSISS